MLAAMTYGVLPTQEEFNEAFEACVDGRYSISFGYSDSQALDGFKLGDGEYTATELWDAITEIVNSEHDPITVSEDDRKNAAMDVVSCILDTLGFEWI
jgi:hypothetical protein